MQYLLMDYHIACTSPHVQQYICVCVVIHTNTYYVTTYIKLRTGGNIQNVKMFISMFGAMYILFPI